MFEQSVGSALTGWSPAQLGQKLKRASAFRDKYRDLLRRQKLASRARTGTKSGPSGDANARTEQKAKLFEEVLQRLDAQRGKLAASAILQEKASARAVLAERTAQMSNGPAATSTPGKRKAFQVKGAVAKRNASMSEKANIAASRAHLANARTKVIQSHVASRGRRQQAARDKR